MTWIRTAALAAFVCIVSGPALSLSCAHPSLDEAALDSAVVIFEGKAGSKRPLTRGETTRVGGQGLRQLGGRRSDLKVYRFTVTRAWKGVARGQALDVLFNTHWGDGFAEGESYLVVSPQAIGRLFWAPLCGHSLELRSAADMGGIATLERVIGIGDHVKISTADRLCQRAQDCTSVQTHCGRCSCGSPVAKSAAEAYEAAIKRLCAMVRVAERCEMNCPPLELSCAEGLCVAD